MTTLSKRLQRARKQDRAQKTVRKLERVSTSDAIGRIRSELRK